MKRVFFVKVLNTTSQLKSSSFLEGIEASLTLASMDVVVSEAYGSKDFYFYGEKEDFKKFLTAIRFSDVDYKVEDITYKIKENLNLVNYPKPKTENIFKIFKLENYNVDDVLDKINEFGIHSLDDIDKQILES